MLFQCLIMVFGFVLLWKGGDALVEGASSIALKYGISPFVVGLTIVAFGTSAPELCVSVIAAMENKADIIFGNVLGSNIANLLFILGVSGMVAPLTFNKIYLKKQLPLSLLLLGVMIILIFSDIGGSVGTFSRMSGVILFCVFIGSMILSVDKDERQEDQQIVVLWKAMAMLLFGMIALPFGAKCVVDPAIFIALNLGVSEVLISVLTVAIGTSLPELVASVAATKKGESQIAIGNIIGSNLFNIGLIISVASSVSELRFNESLLVEALIIVIATTGIMALAYIPPKFKLSKIQSSMILLGYIAYMVTVVMRG